MQKNEFIISIYGHKYLLFLATCINSLYTQKETFLISVYYNDISEDIINKFKVFFKEVNFVKTKIKTRHFGKKLSINNRINYWKLGFENSKSDNICFLDVDTILIKPIDEIFNDDFDIGLTYFKNSKSTFPINAGICFCKKNKNSLSFISEWTDEVNKFITKPKSYYDLYQKYGGGQQLTLMNILGEPKIFKDTTYKIHKNIIKCKWVSCEEYNNCLSESVTDDIRIIHLKSKWHRILLDGVPMESIETRKNSQEILDIFLKHKKEVNELLKEICI